MAFNRAIPTADIMAIMDCNANRIIAGEVGDILAR